MEAYREAHQWKDATAVAAEAAKALPKDHDIQMMYAQQLADTGQVDQGAGAGEGAVDRDRRTIATCTRAGADVHSAEAVQGGERATGQGRCPGDQAGREAVRAASCAESFTSARRCTTRPRLSFARRWRSIRRIPAVLNYLGYMLADQGEKLPEALKMIRKAVDLEPQNGAYLDSLGWVYFKTGQYPQAEENLRKANERMNTDPTVHDHLGEVYEKTGNLKMAVAQWERSMTEYAHSLPADADPEDVQKVQHKLENARVKLAKAGTNESE